MSNVVRTAGVAGTFNYSLSQVPAATPTMTIYSDTARTVVAVPSSALVTTANPAVFTAAYPATLAAGSYFLSFAVVMTVGQPAFVDSDDTLELRAVTGTAGTDYFDNAEGRAADASFADMTDAEIAEARAEVEAEIEALTGVAFVPREATETLSGTGIATLHLDHLYIRSVTAVRTWTTDPATYADFTAAELADIVPSPTGLIRRSTLGYWPYSWQNVRVTYTHGLDAPPANVKHAALALFRYRVASARWRIPSDPVAVDAEGNPTAEGLTAAQTSGRELVDSPTGVPVVDDLLRPWLRAPAVA